MHDAQAEAEKLFEQQLLDEISNKLLELGEIAAREDFLNSYPRENLADVHNGVTGAYFLMNRSTPLKLVEYNLETFTVIRIS